MRGQEDRKWLFLHFSSMYIFLEANESLKHSARREASQLKADIFTDSGTLSLHVVDRRKSVYLSLLLLECFVCSVMNKDLLSFSGNSFSPPILSKQRKVSREKKRGEINIWCRKPQNFLESNYFS